MKIMKMSLIITNNFYKSNVIKNLNKLSFKNINDKNIYANINQDNKIAKYEENSHTKIFQEIMKIFQIIFNF